MEAQKSEKRLPATIEQVALAAIVLLAAGLRFANLATLGYANHYYSAAVASMLQSWHNFFFVAAEPGASVSVDKPPLGLWLQTISAYFLGMNGFAVLLPQIIAGILSVILVYYLVRRWFGAAAGLLAALTLAVTPVVVAVDRNNTMDSTLLLVLLLAAWAFIKAVEAGKARYFLLGTFLVGVGFNIKMMAAFLPLPAFYALYLLASKEHLGRKLLNMGVGLVVLLVVSLSWTVVVDLTPAELRPYVGSSGDNSVMSLAIGYNGVQRLLGMGGMRNRPVGNPQPPSRNAALPNAGYGTGDLRRPFAQRENFDPIRPGVPAQRPAGGFPGRGAGGGPGGGMDTGRPGVLRLFTAPLSKEVSWMLPCALFSLLYLLVRSRLRYPLTLNHKAVVLWGGWLLSGVVFFSIAGFFHPYYLAMIAAPLVALIGIGSIELWKLRQQNPWLGTALILLAAAITLGLQFYTAQVFAGALWWQWLAVGLFLVGAVLLSITVVRQSPRFALTGFIVVLAALLLIPSIWSGLTVLNSSENQSLPSAYSGRTSGPANRGRVQVNQALLDYLQKNTQGITYLMAVPSSMQGADYVLASHRPVLYLGGFMGQDRVVSSADLAQMVAEGKLRYIYWNAMGGGFGNQSDISNWVTNQCKAVTGFETSTRNSGAPDGTLGGQPAAASYNQLFGGFPGGNMRVSLYDCKK